MIDSRAKCEACLVDVSEAISADSVDFVENGKWHAGLIAWEGMDSVPALWFGRDNATPMRRWAITPYITPVDFSFWFKDTDEDMLEAIVDEYDSISVWYLYECGCDLPALTGLIRRCPVKFKKDDSSETISITKHASKKCPNCGSPVQIKGTHWECGYCGNSGIM